MEQDVRLQTLLAATARKDQQAFAALRILKKDAAAQDALQDAFVQIWHRAVDFNSSKGSPMAWMATIVRYRALDILRKQKKLQPMDDIDLSLADTELGPMGKLLESDMARLIWECLEELNDKQRNTILLAFYEGLTHDELAERTTTPLGTIKTWIRRGLQSVKGCLER